MVESNQEKQAEKPSDKKSHASKAPKKKVKKKAAKKVTKKVAKKKAAKKSAKNASGGERKYVLDSVLVINNAHTMHGQLSALINTKKNIVIDASSVEMADTSIFQLLLAFVEKINENNLKVTWMKPSKELISRADMLDLTEKLGLVA